MGSIRAMGLLIACAVVAASSAAAEEPADRAPRSVPARATSSYDVYNPDGSVRMAQATPSPAQPRAAAPAGAQPPTQPPTPPPSAPPAGAAPAPGALAAGEAAAAGAEAAVSALAESTFSETPIMLGDMGPLSVRQFFPTPNLQPPPAPTPLLPPVPQSPAQNTLRAAFILPWVRGFKMADNMSPRPQDRFFFSFNYFNDLNKSLNRRLGDQVSNIQVYRELFGVEKTFFDGNASIGLRMPLNSLSAQSQIPGFGGTNTSVGNLTVFSKFIIWQDERTGSLISSGLAVTTPNGPTSFASAPSAVGFHDTQLQPFIGYIWSRGRFYAHGFESIDIPTLSRDVTMLYNDVGVGYFLYRNPDPYAHLTAIVPTFETHVNVPLNHRGSLRVGDPAGTPDVVDLTFGTNVVFGRNAILTFGLVTPVTGPRPFDLEVSALLNVFFGRTRAAQPVPTPPVVGL